MTQTLNPTVALMLRKPTLPPAHGVSPWGYRTGGFTTTRVCD